MKNIFLVCLLSLLWFIGYSQVGTNDLDQIRKLVREIDSTIDQYKKSYLNDVTLNIDSINDNNSLEGDELYQVIETDMIKYLVMYSK